MAGSMREGFFFLQEGVRGLRPVIGMGRGWSGGNVVGKEGCWSVWGGRDTRAVGRGVRDDWEMGEGGLRGYTGLGLTEWESGGCGRGANRAAGVWV
jgi:hypothetical protein